MQQKWNQNFDGEPMTDIPQKFLNAGGDVYMVMQLRHVVNESSLGLVATLAGVVFGYGVPYTFLSGYEMAEDEGENKEKLVEGGVEADLKAADEESSQETTETVESENDGEESTEE